ncbi:hypothetical protein [Zhaonella formicivorans]|uniref:hypothetical protein n=1 Tax=Zhaonella formicivorans TaxID=2528593 RepID=UPI0010F25D5B|nr:hypothetical protein [Zhaonella formicivorans]
MIPVEKLDLNKKAWQRFTEVGELMPGVRPVIARSWFRCKNYGLKPFTALDKGAEFPASNSGAELIEGEKLLPDEKEIPINKKEGVNKTPVQWETIISVLERVYAWLGLEEVLLVLLHNHTVLARWGQVRPMGPSYWQVGETLREEKYGTIAPVLLQPDISSCQVIGPEHFLACFHDYHSLAVNLRLPELNLGLCVVGPLGRLGPQTEGLFMAVEELLQLRLAEKRKGGTSPVTLNSSSLPLAKDESLAILEAYDKFSGNISQTAEAVDMGSNTLREYGITTEEKEINWCFYSG